MNRTEILNKLAQEINAESYLEIGVDDGNNFNSIICENKTSVDPFPIIPVSYKMSSDEFFHVNYQTYDLIFIDGLHHADQVLKDIENSLEVLNPRGRIVCHDTCPKTKKAQEIPYTGIGDWNGDCWKAIVQLRMSNPNVSVITYDIDHGVTIIEKTPSDILGLNKSDLTYENFDKNRKNWLNIMSENVLPENTDSDIIKSLIKTYIQTPNDPEINWQLAQEYENIGQLASAVSFYIRTAERTKSELLKFECLIRCAMCFTTQGTRAFTVKGMLQHAIATMPTRPEGYYLLSRYHELDDKDGKWFDSYTAASIGIALTDHANLEPLRTKVDYPGKYALLFQKARTAWYCGLCVDSKNMFLDLYANYQMEEPFKTLTFNNLKNMNAFASESITKYTSEHHEKLKRNFNGSETITENYSEAFQDMFVLSMLDGKRNGTYVEIGSGDPSYGNNTYLLEKDFNWNGVSLDINPDLVKAHNEQRNHTCILRDATITDYTKLFAGLGLGSEIDYLQIDCDPPSVSFKVLLSIPFETHKFGVITFEHDHYADPDGNYREKSRRYLDSQGYVLVASNIAPDSNRPYEDWYINPDLIDPNDIADFLSTEETTKVASEYMLSS